MKDYITAKQRLSFPWKNRWLNGIFILLGLLVVIFFNYYLRGQI